MLFARVACYSHAPSAPLALSDLDGFAPCIFFVFIAVAIIAGVLSYQQARKRREELARYARAKGLRFTPGNDGSMDNRFGCFSCLQQGDNRYACNVMEGTAAPGPLCAFDYHYETHSTDSKGRRQTHHYRFSALIVTCGLPLKPLFIRPEGFFDKITEFFGYDDIDFESSEFSRKFYVKSPDKKWAFDVLHQATMEFLLHSPVFTLDFQGPHIMAYRNDTFKTDEFDAALAVLAGILDRFPEYLLHELKGVE